MPRAQKPNACKYAQTVAVHTATHYFSISVIAGPKMRIDDLTMAHLPFFPEAMWGRWTWSSDLCYDLVKIMFNLFEIYTYTALTHIMTCM